MWKEGSRARARVSNVVSCVLCLLRFNACAGGEVSVATWTTWKLSRDVFAWLLFTTASSPTFDRQLQCISGWRSIDPFAYIASLYLLNINNVHLVQSYGRRAASSPCRVSSVDAGGSGECWRAQDRGVSRFADIVATHDRRGAKARHTTDRADTDRRRNRDRGSKGRKGEEAQGQAC